MKLIRIEPAGTDRAPAVALTFGNADLSQVYVAWKNPDDAKKNPATIWYSYSADNIHWSAPAQIKGKDSKGNDWAAETDEGPSLALENDQPPGPFFLVAAWKGKVGNDIWYSKTSNGVHWTDQATVPDAKTASAPSLTSNSSAGPVAVAWRALDDSINYTTFPFGVLSWGGSAPVTRAKSDQAPALGSTGLYGGGLLVAWKGKSDNFLWYESVGGASSPKKVEGSGFTASSSAGPSLPSETDGIGLAWKDEKDTSIWISKDFVGTAPTRQKVPDISTNSAPAWLGVGAVLAFRAKNLKVDGIPVKDDTIWTCIP
jgi:hypothetical protein